MSNENNNPDFYIFYDEELGRNKNRLIRVGAAWKHGKGDGISISLDSIPIRDFDGSLVAFPPLEDDETGKKTKA